MTQGWDPQTGGQPSGQPEGYPAQGYDPNAGYPATQGYDQQAGYQGQPGYPGAAPGYPGQPGYPGAQHGYPGQPYAPPGYQPGYFVPAPAAATKPGSVKASAVLAFIQAGFVLISGITLLSGSTAFMDISETSSIATELMVVAIVTILTGGLLIAGGAQVFNGKLQLIVIAAVVSLLLSVYWFIRLTSLDVEAGVAMIWPMIFAVLPIIIISLCLGSTAKTWAASVQARQ